MPATVHGGLEFGDDLTILAAKAASVVALLVTTCTVILAGAAVSLRDYYSFASGVSWRATRLVERCDLEVEPLPCGWLRVAKCFEVMPGD